MVPEQTGAQIPDLSYAAIPVVCAQGSRHPESCTDYAEDAPLGKVCQAALERASINIYLVCFPWLWACVFGEKYTRKECSVSLSAGLVYQRSPSANLTGAWKGYAVTKLQSIALDVRNI